MTTLRDGTKEEGKYKCNVLITSKKKKHLFLIRSAKFRERVEASVSSSQRASKYALQKADIAVSRTSTARSKGDMADTVADHAKVDSEVAVATAREFAPDFKPSVLDRFDRIRDRERFRPMNADTTTNSATAAAIASPLKHHPNPHLPHPTQPSANNDPHRATANFNNHPQPVTPVKQAQFAPQSTIRRTSMMHKQDSFDYAAPQNQSQHGGAAMANNNVNYPSTIKTQQQQHQQQLLQQQNLAAQQHSVDPYATNNQRAANNEQITNSYGATTNYQNDQFNASQRNNMYDQKPAMYNNIDSSANGLGYNNYANNTVDPNSSYGSPQLQQQQQMYGNQQQPQQHMNSFQAAEQLSTNLYQMDGMAAHMNHINAQLPPTNQQGIDHFDHYKRVPSRDSSMDRYARAASRLGGGASGSRQPSMDRQAGMTSAAPVATKEQTPEKRLRSDSVARMAGAAPPANFGGGGGGGGGVKRASISSFQPQSVSPSHIAIYSSPNQPFEDVLLRQRTLGQDIIPSPREPKRTESLYLPPKPLIGNGGVSRGGGGGAGKQLKVC